MLSLSEAGVVLAAIRSHHGNAMIDAQQVEQFRSELKESMTVAEALEAVRRFYSQDVTGRWCMAGNVNAIVTGMRNQSKPTEAQIGRECERLGLDADQSWMYRRQRMLGKPQAEANRIATGYRPQIEAAKPKKRPRPGVGFNPNLKISLTDVIGTGHGQ
ncbi:hypothetical protein [Bifidobacterium sp. SO1]|uniref:hypothetical protein n=1 Tax=Bifidobacterium sp. SO1 TaxID=2809029 RepID=UPI001BDD9FB8|nr:hypothetical protein [Bifidobacterium sp. SO1]MBT1161253.1 hypothetical protein [Bifidobacterium sp. SO1]